MFFTSKDHCNVHQLFIVASCQLLLPVIQKFFFRCRDFQSEEKKSTKIKCLLFIIVKNYRNFTLQKLPVIWYFISITLIYRYCTNIKYFTSIFVSGISSKLQSVPYHFSFLSVLSSNFLLTTKTLENINAIYSYIYMYQQINCDLDYLCVVITATYHAQ